MEANVSFSINVEIIGIGRKYIC